MTEANKGKRTRDTKAVGQTGDIGKLKRAIYDRQLTAPKMRPSELFQRNCWISFEPVENSIAVLADYIGPHKIMWATDYPHQDGFFPGAPKMIRDRLGPLSAEAKHQVMAGGALGFYGMN